MIVFGLSGSHSDRVCVEGYWGVVGGGWVGGGGGGGWWVGRGELVEAGGLARGGGGWLAYHVITCNELCSWSLRAGEEEVLPLRLLLTDC